MLMLKAWSHRLWAKDIKSPALLAKGVIIGLPIDMRLI